MLYRFAEYVEQFLPLAPLLGAIYVIGQVVPDMAFPDFGSLTATAILGWYAWHNTNYTLPSIVKDFREELQIERKVNDDNQREIRAQFFQELREAREYYKQSK